MFSSCQTVSSLIFSSYDEHALISGISDIAVVEWSPSEYKTSPFLVCFGSHTHQVSNTFITIRVNHEQVSSQEFKVNRYGYIEPFHPSSQVIRSFNLKHGLNIIEFEADDITLRSEIHLYSLTDQIVISDMDGTMTKTDVRGLYHNYFDQHYLHEGYETFLKELIRNGYKIIWITMRSITMYSFSKRYISKHVGTEGALFPEPEQFFPSLKKELMKKTANIKINMIRMIRNLFPPDINPFVAGLGNRENDAIVYLAAGVPTSKIYTVEKNSQLQTLDGLVIENYGKLFQEIDLHFPDINEGSKRKKKFIKMKLKKNAEKYSIRELIGSKRERVMKEDEEFSM